MTTLPENEERPGPENPREIQRRLPARWRWRFALSRPKPRSLMVLDDGERELALSFGIVPPEIKGRGAQPGARGKLADAMSISARPGDVISVRGPSGSGKSAFLSALARRKPRRAPGDSPPRIMFLESVNLEPDAPAIRQPRGLLAERIRFLSRAGLADPLAWMRAPGDLSEGQRYRLQLAVALSRRPQALFCDEFCSSLDRVTARVVACSVRRAVRRAGILLATATAHDDLDEDLAPDVIVRFSMAGGARVLRRRRTNPLPGVLRDMAVERGSRRDWPPMAPWHYRSGSLGVVDRVFVLRHRAEVVGICVYAFSPLEARMRMHSLPAGAPVDRRSRARVVNREFRTLQRIVLDERFRGVGLAAYLLRETLPLAGAPRVECFTELGNHLPFLERAGFQPVGRCPPFEGTRRAMDALRRAGARTRDTANPRALSAFLEKRLPKDPALRRAVLTWLGRHSARSSFCRGETGADFLSARLASVAERLWRSRRSQPAYYLWRREESA